MKVGRLLLRPFLRRRNPVGLGKLERQVMDVLWREAVPASVREVQARLGGQLAYTTVMTTLDRLFRKELLVRSRDRRAFLYAPACTRAQLERGLAAHLLQGLLGRRLAEAEPVLSSIVDAVSERDRRLLARLDRLVQARLRRDREPR